MQRSLGMFIIQQRTKDGMFNATALLKQWNEATGSNKEVKDYLRNDATKEFIKALVEEENLHGENSPYVKSKARADRGGGTWMHPLLFTDFAMWVNPSFKVKVLKFVFDQMIKYRNESGEAYKALSAAIYSIVSKEQMKDAMCRVSKGINYIVFGEHYAMVRNAHGDEEQQRALFELERKVADLINEGFIDSINGVMSYLRKKWNDKMNTPQILREGQK